MTLRYLDVVDVGDVPAVADGVLQRAVRDDRETTRLREERHVAERYPFLRQEAQLK